MEQEAVEKRFSLSASWLRDVIDLKAPSGQDRGIQECLDLQRQIDALGSEIREKLNASSAIAEEQERLIKLIPNGHGEQANAWRTDLAITEKELRELKRSTLPKLKGRLKEAHDALHEAFHKLRYSWSEDSKV